MKSAKEKLDEVLAVIPPATHALEPVMLQAEPEPLEIDLQRTAVVVVDVQNCFVSKGGMFDLWGWDITPGQTVIEPIEKITNIARAKGLKVVKVAHVYAPDLSNTGGPNSPNWYKNLQLPSLREHPEWGDKFNIRGTWGAEIIDELKPQEGDLYVEKPRYSAFFATDLDILLQTHNIKYLIFTGLTTNVCVEHSIRDAYNYDYFPIIISDATMNNGPSFCQDATLFNIQCVFGWVTTTENILKAMGLKKVKATV